MDGSGALYRQVVDSSPDGIWVLDPAGRTIYANARTAALLDRPASAFEALTLTDVLDPGERDRFARHLRELYDGRGSPTETSCTCVTASGASFTVLVATSVLRDDAGGVTGVVHRLSPDDSRQHLVHELSRSREQLDEAQSIARVGSWELDLVEDRLSWSHQLYTILGLDPLDQEPTPLGLLERVVESDRDTLVGAIQRARDFGEDVFFDVRMRRSDGSVGWFRGRGRVVFAENGTALRLGGTLQDITDLKDTELQLVDAVILNALMRVMATAANNSETLLDALTITREQLLSHDDWQRAVAFRVVPEPGGSALLEPFSAPDDDPDLLPGEHEREVAQRVLDTGTTVLDEETNPGAPSIGFAIRLGKEPLMVLVITARSPFERHAMLRSMVEQVADQLGRVAERERAARELATARDAAMEASRLKSGFLATMSHEIRTPMNGVVGLNDLLLRTDLDHHQRRLAQGVQVAGQALLGLLNDILDFSKIESGQLELEVADFDVRSVFEQVETMVGSTAHDKGIGFSVQVADRVPVRLLGDPIRLGQVVANLASNAVKFTAAGQVAITAEVVDEGVEGVVLRVEVSDTGIGIEPEQMERLFEPFRQADASTTRTFGGTGLGLAICRQLVSALGGEIGLTSVPGLGSTFWFTARFRSPATHSAADVRAAASGTRTQERHGHVLVVEDNEINQLVALGLLETLGYTAEVAESGVDAVAKAATKQYDAILMDLQMPRMDGYSASRLIRRSEVDTHVPIIAMTASAIEGERERCVEAGMDDFISKPVNSERMASVLRAHIASHPTGGGGHPEPAAGPGGLAEAEEAELVLDETRLDELAAMGPRAVVLIDRAVANFVSHAEEVVAALESAVGSGDDEQVRALAHKFRGSALNLGAKQVAAVGLRLERLTEDGPGTDPGPVVAELRKATEAAASALQEYQARVARG